jgi:hypothetical protein
MRGTRDLGRIRAAEQVTSWQPLPPGLGRPAAGRGRGRGSDGRTEEGGGRRRGWALGLGAGRWGLGAGALGLGAGAGRWAAALGRVLVASLQSGHEVDAALSG